MKPVRATVVRPKPEQPDAGEENLVKVVRLAGEEAQRRKSEAMAKHYDKIRMVVSQATAKKNPVSA